MTNTNKKYYEATLKGGHVRRSNYIIFWHYVIADSKKEVAEICKTLPRVKKDHKDYILELKEITFEEYMEGRKRELYDPYLKCMNKQQQEAIYELIKNRIVIDSHYFETMPKEKKRFYNKTVKKQKNKKSYMKYVDTFMWENKYVYVA